MTTNIVSTLTIRISERSRSYYIEASGLGVEVKSLPFAWTATEDDLEIVDLLHSVDATHVWDVTQGNEIASLKYEDSRGMAIAFSPDSKWVVTGIDNFDACIFDITDNREISKLTHDGRVFAVTFSPDGKTVISAGEDKTARVWDAASGIELARMTFDKRICWASFSIDGKYAITSDLDHEIDVWLWRPEDLIAEACARLSRNLTTEEWNQYIGNEPYQPTCTNLPTSKN